MKKSLLKSILLTTLATSLLFVSVGCGTQTPPEATQSEAPASETTPSEATPSEATPSEATSTQTAEQTAAEAEFAVTELPQLEPPAKGEDIAIIKTSEGDITVQFFPEYAPLAVENFLTLAEQDYYDGVIFHRVINGFMIQSGDPEGTGMGGKSIYEGGTFEYETTPNLRHFRGALAMAHSGAPASNGSQFYIVQNNDIGEQGKALAEKMKTDPDFEVPIDDKGTVVKISDVVPLEKFPPEVMDVYAAQGGTPQLDFGYTVFGQVIEGMDVVDKIAATEIGAQDKPVNDIVIEDVVITTYDK